jgi:hypothetical protein
MGHMEPYEPYGRPTREREFWGSIPKVVMRKNLGQVSDFYTAPGHTRVVFLGGTKENL